MLAWGLKCGIFTSDRAAVWEGIHSPVFPVHLAGGNWEGASLSMLLSALIQIYTPSSLKWVRVCVFFVVKEENLCTSKRIT